jgi:UDP-3-O-[3-hydroxymyristoyl] N-acetylglucosamine deacetylase
MIPRVNLILKIMQQKTLKQSVEFSGIGVHSGVVVKVILEPASVDCGIFFNRFDMPKESRIKATFDHVTDTMMSTTLTGENMATVSTVEHLMSALSGCGITNCLISISGQEMPIMDGSALSFCDVIKKAGIQDQEKSCKKIKVLKTIFVGNDQSWVKLTPSTERTFSMTFDFYGKIPKELIPSKTYHFNMDREVFCDQIAHARTFGLYEDAERLQKMGLARGANLENTVIVKNGVFLNENGLKEPNELIKHKILDAIGDLALSPYPLITHYEAYNASHMLNNKALRLLFEENANYIIE